jgi:pyruvate/2-oxoacid:ferredoxin oxidoreductase alpha subunit
LRIFRSGTSVVAAWPVAASGFTLQSKTDLDAANWTDVAQTPVIVGSEKFITNSAPTGNQFFRLRN